MSVYLHDIPLVEAHAVFRRALLAHGLLSGLNNVLAEEVIAVDEHGVGRTLSRPVFAKISAPHYHASAMDGFAVRAHETDGALLTAPITLQYGTQTEYVDTGDPLPAWANGVIQIEKTEPVYAPPLNPPRREGDQESPSLREGLGEGGVQDVRSPTAIRIREAVPPWRNVRPLGEDMVATQLVLPAGHTIRPVDLGAIAGSGNGEIVVAKRPRVAVIPTGSELVTVGTTPKVGDIIEYNSIVLAGQVREWGGVPTRWPIVPDVFDAIRDAVKEAAETHDLILLNAGSSAGAEDYSAGVIGELGEVLLHGVAVRPGHPVILGMVKVERGEGRDERHVPIVGVPGYPVSAALTGEIFVRPLLMEWQGKTERKRETVEATLTRKLVSPAGDDDFVRVAVGNVDGRTLAAPLTRGAGVISSLVQADGLLVVPSGSQGLGSGAAVNIQLLRSRDEIERTILAIGSHDMTLDVVNQLLAAHDRRLSSANVGSLGGLIALRRGEAHLAGSHLLDPETGLYNESYIGRYLADVAVKRVVLVGRSQGLIVQKGNPKGLKTLADVARDDVQFVNRQRGAGTRVLFDYQLGLAEIASENVRGYEHEEYTHLGVASGVAGGRADCGLGIEAAAVALDLDFVPLFTEQYELIIPEKFVESPLLAPLFDVINGAQFREMVGRLAGYDVSQSGKKV